jgi:hypothetical protein
MTETNLFQEVQDDLERQRMEALWKRYGNMAITLMLVIIVGTAAFSAWTSWRTGKNQAATGELMAFFTDKDMDTDKKIKALNNFAYEHPNTAQSALAMLRAAELEAGLGQSDKAVAIYDKLAKNKEVDPSFQRFAALMSAREQMDSGNPKELIAKLDPLAAPDSPWHAEAKEYQGYLALRDNDIAKAKQIFTDLSQDASVPRSLSLRSAEMLRYLDQ